MSKSAETAAPAATAAGGGSDDMSRYMQGAETVYQGYLTKKGEKRGLTGESWKKR